MIYRVYGLRKLGKLFPNLTVIGGHRLFHNYAFIIYEVSDLEEIGLHSLARIGGAVRLTKNPKLCYINTIDWNKLGVTDSARDFKENKNPDLCPDFCPDKCPDTVMPWNGGYSKRCWNAEYCQKNLGEFLPFQMIKFCHNVQFLNLL